MTQAAASPRVADSPAAPSQVTVWLALSAVYVIWGSTYLAIRIVVDSMPALGSMGARFVVAAVLMGGFLLVRRGRRALALPWPSLASAALVGCLLLIGGNGGVALGEKTVPSGLAALLVAAMPLWLVLLRTSAGDRPRWLTVAGTLVGFAGIAVLARPGSHGDDVELWGILFIIGATMTWAFGSFISARIPMPADAFVATVWEMFIAGALMVVISMATGEWFDVDWSAVPASDWAALAYLVVFGSLVAFTAFVWLLANAPVSLVSTYAYVNPVVAVLLGALILSEPITAAIVAGGALAVFGVALVVRGERPRGDNPESDDPESDDAEEPVAAADPASAVVELPDSQARQGIDDATRSTTSVACGSPTEMRKPSSP